MASWFYASEGKQQGPFPEAQFRDLVTRGTIRSDTLVWTEGMAGWQKAAEIPGLIGGGSAPPMMPAGGPPMMGSGGYGGGGAGTARVRSPSRSRVPLPPAAPGAPAAVDSRRASRPRSRCSS